MMILFPSYELLPKVHKAAIGEEAKISEKVDTEATEDRDTILQPKARVMRGERHALRLSYDDQWNANQPLEPPLSLG
jgi:hypothetical protein